MVTVRLASKVGAPTEVQAHVSGVWALHGRTVTHVPTGTRACSGSPAEAEAMWLDLAATWPDYAAGAAFGEQDARRLDPRVREMAEWFGAAMERHGVGR